MVHIMTGWALDADLCAAVSCDKKIGKRDEEGSAGWQNRLSLFPSRLLNKSVEALGCRPLTATGLCANGGSVLCSGHLTEGCFKGGLQVMCTVNTLLVYTTAGHHRSRPMV